VPSAPGSRHPDVTDAALHDSLLETRLVSLLGDSIVVMKRVTNSFESTFPSETVVCRLDSQLLRLHCKSSSWHSHDAYGHRGDIPREIVAYRDVLPALGAGTAQYVGAVTDAAGSFLAIEHLDGAARLDATRDAPAALAAAAAWAGAFHRISERSVERAATAGIPRYDASYYASWVERTWELATPWHARLPWLQELCGHAEAIGALIAQTVPVTVIHGEFTPHNVLLQEGRVVPVDWESIAIAFGEIDLAALIDKWPDPVQRACADAYQAARWRSGSPESFASRLDLGRLYWDFRWLGDRPEWTASEQVGPRFAHLRTVATRLSLPGAEET